MKVVGLFVIKSVAFTLIFWMLWMFVLLPISRIGQQSDSNDDLTKKYWEQVMRADQLHERADRLHDVYEKQTEQTASYLQKQGELLARWEKVIESWEKTSPGH